MCARHGGPASDTSRQIMQLAGAIRHVEGALTGVPVVVPPTRGALTRLPSSNVRDAVRRVGPMRSEGGGCA